MNFLRRRRAASSSAPRAVQAAAAPARPTLRQRARSAYHRALIRGLMAQLSEVVRFMAPMAVNAVIIAFAVIGMLLSALVWAGALVLSTHQ